VAFLSQQEAIARMSQPQKERNIRILEEQLGPMARPTPRPSTPATPFAIPVHPAIKMVGLTGTDAEAVALQVALAPPSKNHWNRWSPAERAHMSRETRLEYGDSDASDVDPVDRDGHRRQAETGDDEGGYARNEMASIMSHLRSHGKTGDVNHLSAARRLLDDLITKARTTAAEVAGPMMGKVTCAFSADPGVVLK